MSALVLIVVGAIADRSPRQKRLFAAFAWAGVRSRRPAWSSSPAPAGSWASLLLILANLCLGASLVVYDSILCRIAAPDERDRVSSRGWAFGYLGGGLLLALNLAVVSLHDALGMSEGDAVRVSLLSAGLWWAAFTFIPVAGSARPAPARRRPGAERGWRRRWQFGQLWGRSPSCGTTP